MSLSLFLDSFFFSFQSLLSLIVNFFVPTRISPASLFAVSRDSPSQRTEFPRPNRYILLSDGRAPCVTGMPKRDHPSLRTKPMVAGASNANTTSGGGGPVNPGTHLIISTYGTSIFFSNSPPRFSSRDWSVGEFAGRA